MGQATKQEIVTESLNLQQILERLDEATRLFETWGEESVVVTFGWNCPANLLWTSQTIAVGDLPSLIRSQDLGAADLFASDRADSSRFLFCHESDVHFTGVDHTRIETVSEVWKAKGLKPMISPVSEDPRVPREWKAC